MLEGGECDRWSYRGEGTCWRVNVGNVWLSHCRQHFDSLCRSGVCLISQAEVRSGCDLDCDKGAVAFLTQHQKTEPWGRQNLCVRCGAHLKTKHPTPN